MDRTSFRTMDLEHMTIDDLDNMPKRNLVTYRKVIKYNGDEMMETSSSESDMSADSFSPVPMVLRKRFGDRYKTIQNNFRIAGNSAPGILFIENVNIKALDSNIFKLFKKFGSLRDATVHCDRYGMPRGTADVVFEKHSDARAAMKKLNKSEFMGKSIQIEIVL